MKLMWFSYLILSVFGPAMEESVTLIHRVEYGLGLFSFISTVLISSMSPMFCRISHVP